MSIYSYVRRHSFIATILVVIVVIIGLMAGRSGSSSTQEVAKPTIKKVVLVPASSFKKNSSTLTVDGIVESRGQADLKSQASAPIAIIQGKIGDSVYAGEVIVELSNADIRAQLEQARASLALATSQYETGGYSLSSARSGAMDKVRDAYLKGSDAVNSQIDPLLNNYDGNGGRLSSFVGDQTLNHRITEERVDLTDILPAWQNAINSLSTEPDTNSLLSVIKLSEKNIALIDKLLSDISEGLNSASKYALPNFATFLNNWKGIVSGARATLSGSAQALTGAESSLTTADSSLGGTAKAQISVAQAGLKNLEAQLEKTIIRSPIDGKIAALPLGVGELASPGTLVATVVGNSGLQIKTYVSGDDFSGIKVGSVVTIGQNIKGSIESLAPSLNSANRKVEVIVRVLESDSAKLVIGQTVSVQITLDQKASESQDKIGYLLPIQDVKIVPGDAYVYTVGPDSKIVRNPVVLGNVNGDFIEVTSGLKDDMSLVSPVYELDEGQVVEVGE